MPKSKQYMQFGLICKQIVGQSYCAGTKCIYTLYFAYVCFHIMLYARPVFQLHSIPAYTIATWGYGK